MSNFHPIGRSAPSRARNTWRSLTLRSWVLGLLLGTEIGLLVGIVILQVLSKQNDGFVKIRTQTITEPALSYEGTVQRAKSLLWTSVPTLIFTFYRIFRDSVITSFTVETPYMELYKTIQGPTIKLGRSAYLDYRTYLAPVALFKAFKNGHRFLGTCMLISFPVSIILVPLAARLFSEGMVLDIMTMDVNMLSSYMPPENMAIVDYAAVMDAVSASWIYGASYPSSTDGTYSFPRVSPKEARENYTITVDTNSPQLTLDCALVDSPITSFEQATPDTGQIKFSGDDRGCNVSGTASFSSAWNTYLRAFETHSCDESVSGIRLFYFYATAQNAGREPDHSAIVSCIPTFWNVTGFLDVVSTVGFTRTRVEVPAFTATLHEVADLPAFSDQQFTYSIMGVGILNPSSGADTNTPNRVAELVARDIAAKKLVLSEATIIDSAKIIIPAIYTMMNVQYYFPDLPIPAEQEGVLRAPENRLHVVTYAAATMLVVLGMLIVETICLFIYIHKHCTILPEEPVGLIGAANLLHNSNIPQIIDTFHQHPAFDGRLHRELDRPESEKTTPRAWLSTLTCRSKQPKKTYTDDYLLEKDCYVVRSQTCPCLQIIVRDADDSKQARRTALRCCHNCTDEPSATSMGIPESNPVAVNTHAPITTTNTTVTAPYSQTLSQPPPTHNIPRKALSKNSSVPNAGNTIRSMSSQSQSMSQASGGSNDLYWRHQMPDPILDVGTIRRRKPTMLKRGRTPDI
ncbi:hypothetical protein LTR70_003468 [Exophiala xenobiotica]|uniref:Uncharacterized protein n=1 Tax=Lithohypha guttulata TaxID=1690604 RepID=A0ABR0KG49_9EURO|nr:hypothetical protein LTR24_003016 [Lithohypha guttulata]KAK5323006.1 hypothetical protein LTR70_003468 [Exophiala xenobiotica]